MVVLGQIRVHKWYYEFSSIVSPARQSVMRTQTVFFFVIDKKTTSAWQGYCDKHAVTNIVFIFMYNISATERLLGLYKI